MINPKILDDLAAKFSAVLANLPANEVEKNVKAVLASTFSRLDLVSREEFDVQQGVLAKAREKLADMEARLAALEAKKTAP
jgi:ubiquinone biosynthesis accessory factor UbiK